MIISASRRCDIPAFYSEWFIDKIQKGFVLVRNPMNARQISRIDLTPEAVDCIVFWSKNPEPMLAGLDKLECYKYYFQFTLNGYGKDAEPNLPAQERRIETFMKLSEKLGRSRVVWRYDPVFLSGAYTAGFHKEKFQYLAERLSGYTDRCVISFIDMYKKIQKAMCRLGAFAPDSSVQAELAEWIGRTAKRCGMEAVSCCEPLNMEPYGIGAGHCIDKALITKLCGYTLHAADKDKNQRPGCGCMPSVDIGSYNTCAHGCKYCYASFSPGSVRKNTAQYSPSQPLLCGWPGEKDMIYDRRL